ncbi:uncharacterized protein RCC_05889 [Ramularia collo-cygni]|uniref:BHLH domain-containing protein n=1 Tax=Ramularia collo-cygni TaxID=112498 RepID=A0A2D3US09_9PEZI|nr:uncharacterized protein RCC_05889 [Ramularia collo-cygni]CZT20032.1 uncharacterized protein RCC_05889 [Ramularia collo-cygni]
MSEAVINDAWRRQYLHQMSMPVNHWQAGPGLVDGGIQDADLRMFQPEAADYEESYHNDTNELISHLNYAPEASWGSDMDMATPSTAGLTSDALDGYHNLRHTSTINQHLNLQVRHERMTSAAHSPHSSYSGMSPHRYHVKPHEALRKEERPNLTRAITAPAIVDQRPRRSAYTAGSPPVKRSASEDEDDEYVPSEDAKPRGRKRQRIPHTAVERRYRENLNAHLDKLRQTVPSLVSKPPAGASKLGGTVGEGVKPSKCEILNGAIEHIGALGKENSALKTECKALKSRLEDLERWLPHR